MAIETVRIMMTDLKLWKPRLKKQSKKWHIWRARKDNYGEKQQFDMYTQFWQEKVKYVIIYLVVY